MGENETRERRLLGWLKLARCAALGARGAWALAERVDIERLGSAQASLADASYAGAPPELFGPELHKAVGGEVVAAQRSGWTFVTLDSPEYPALLHHLRHPPLVLCVRGDVATLRRNAIAVVGSRHASGYGLRMAAELTGPLAAAGFVVVSGLATGIDEAAHRAALDAGGATIAVMGTGPDRIYPAQHRRLAQAIAGNGALVTEFPPGAAPLPRHFPRRNRIIAGLSDAVVVVEATPKSGSLITVDWALELGRPVLAVPGRAGEPLSEGALSLIRDGAALACSPEDVVFELPAWRRPDTPLPTHPGEGRTAIETESESPDGAPPGWPVDPEAALVLEVFPKDDELHVDEVLARTGRPTERVLAALFTLQLTGLLKALPGGHFRRTPTGGAKLAV